MQSNHLGSFYETFNTSQREVSPNLLPLLHKYQRGIFLRPFPSHQRQAFSSIVDFIAEKGRPIIVDSGCGTGLSSINLALHFPDHLVVGIDKSLARLQKAYEVPENCLLVRADYFDMWRLFKDEGVLASKHFMLYPNPWPKIGHLKRRFYAHPAFFSMATLSPYFEMRCNWELFVNEAKVAFDFLGFDTVIDQIIVSNPLSLFERKYQQSQCRLFRLIATKVIHTPPFQ